MRVVTFNMQSFIDNCKHLEQTCGDFNPDLVIGIETGGVYVANQIFKDKPHLTLGAHRRTTTAKDRLGFIFHIIRHFPIRILNFFRIIESEILSYSTHKQIKEVYIDADITQDLKRAGRILIVDDAVDSGVTMKSIVEAVKEFVDSDTLIKTAAITITTKNPMIIPDYYIYNNRTLIRFPWSKDN